MELGLIFFFLTNIVTCAFLITTTFQPISATLALAFAFINTALIFLAMGFEFIALIYLIVYVGAVIILFLFSILLLHLKHERSALNNRAIESPYKALVCFFVLNYIGCIFFLFICENGEFEEIFNYTPTAPVEFFKEVYPKNFLQSTHILKKVNGNWILSRSYQNEPTGLLSVTGTFEKSAMYKNFHPLQLPVAFNFSGYIIPRKDVKDLFNLETILTTSNGLVKILKQTYATNIPEKFFFIFSKQFNISKIEHALDLSMLNLSLKKENYLFNFKDNLTVNYDILPNNPLALYPSNMFLIPNEKISLTHPEAFKTRWNASSNYLVRDFPTYWTFFNLPESSKEGLHLITTYNTLKDFISYKDSIILNSEYDFFDLDFYENFDTSNPNSSKDAPISELFCEDAFESELETLGSIMYTRGCVYFILVSVLLLVALIGSVVLINTNSAGLIEPNNSINQLARSPILLLFK